MKPGITDGVPEDEYFADPALSQSQAKTLLDCPARYRWERENPQPHRDAFDIGHAAHSKVLGVGAEVVAIDVDSRRGKAWTEPADAARAEGKVPLLRKDADAVDAMAEAVLAHPMARAILESQGKAEQTLTWTDLTTEVDLRGRVDWLTTMADGTPFLADLKTSRSAEPKDFGKSAANFGYYLQSAWYTTGFEAITGQPARFGFIVVEKEPPHFVTAGDLDGTAHDIGERQMRDAIDIYRRCTETGIWPAYSDDFITYPTPRWAS